MKILKSIDGNLAELDLEKEAETSKAILISDGNTECWIPKSQLEDDYEELPSGLIRIIIPEWLAIEKELV